MNKKQLAEIMDNSKPGILMSWNYRAERGITSYKYYSWKEMMSTCLKFGIRIGEQIGLQGQDAFNNRTHKRDECPYRGIDKMIWQEAWDYAQSKAAEDWVTDQVEQNR